MPETIILTRQGPIGRLRLNRPAKLNAQTPQMWRELCELGRELRDDRDLRCLVVGGEGRAFSSGIDLSEITGRDGLAAAAGAGEDRLAALIRQGQEAFSWLVEAPFASIGAIRGYALGAGLQLALACDLRVAARTTQLGAVEFRYGLPTWAAPRGCPAWSGRPGRRSSSSPRPASTPTRRSASAS
jgi:enoyl-CoA hydratase/carnithine racemase